MPREPSTASPSAKRCSNCQALEKELDTVRQARDEAVLALARERESFEQTVANLQRPPETAVASVARSRHVDDLDEEEAEVPLRHQIADQINDRFKQMLGPWHRRLKQAVGVVQK